MYLAGFGNHHQTEAIPGALPTKQNSPQKCPLGLFAEQLNGSAFTRQRHKNLHSWTYRKLPSVVHQDYVLYSKKITTSYAKHQAPNPMRWSTFKPSQKPTDFLSGIYHIAGNLNLNSYLYLCNQSMINSYFRNHDAELLFVPYQGDLTLHTEFGLLNISPGMIAVIPRGVAFKVELLNNTAGGYLCENKGLPLTLPELGPIGSNCLANPRHFLYPTAKIEETEGEIQLFCQYQDYLWTTTTTSSPLNVVAWHGNYAPYIYDLSLFNTVNTVSFDHPDPSIFTVLTSESEIAGVANMDFVIFPPRWMVAIDTFRPPYFHRNIMSEFMGLIFGEYDAKASGFDVGGFSIHNSMTAHGPDFDSYQKAINKELKPTYYGNTLAFMFESRNPWLYTEDAFRSPSRQLRYTDCWQEININRP